MPTLVLNYGVDPITVDAVRAGQAQPRRVGGKTPGFLGAEDSDIRAEFMVLPLVISPRSLDDAKAIRELVALGAQFPCRGDVFLNGGATTVTCSGKISDELDQAASWVTINLTLFEIGSVTYTRPPAIYLTNLADDDTGAFRKAWTTVEGGFANTGTATILDGVAITTCGGGPGANCPLVVTDPDTPEVEWLSTAFLADGTLAGAPIVSLQSIGSTADKWNVQHVRAVLELVRAGSVVYSVTTAYSAGNGGFAGGQITMTASSAGFASGLIGDRVRVKIFGQAGLHGGYSDDPSDRQVVTYGYTGAGDYYSKLAWGELAYLLDPTLRP